MGKAAFVLGDITDAGDSTIWLADETGWVASFELQDSLREGADETVKCLRQDGLQLEVLSGDSADAVTDFCA